MKIFNRNLICISLLTFFVFFAASIYAQNFEGKLSYSIVYKAKTKTVNLKNLAVDQGNKEIVNVKKGLYKSVRMYNNDTIGTIVYRNSDNLKCSHLKGDNYSTLEHFGNDTSEHVVKITDFTVLGNYNCESYQSKRGNATYTFYILKGSDANSGYGKPSNYVISPFNGILAGLTIETSTYISTRFLVSKDEIKIDDNVFDFDNYLKLTSPNELTKDVISASERKEFLKCLSKKVKYPFYMQLNKLEGKVYIDLIINKEGKIIDKKLEVDFFRENSKYEKISSKKRIKCIRRHIANKIIVCVNNSCINDLKLDIPTTKTGAVNTIVKFPIAFGNIYFDDREDKSVDSDFQNDGTDYNDYHDYYDNYD